MSYIQGDFQLKGRKRILSNHVRQSRTETLPGRGTIVTQRGILGDIQYHVSREILDPRGYIVPVYNVVGTHQEAHKLCLEGGKG
jgi:hypothetical protein